MSIADAIFKLDTFANAGHDIVLRRFGDVNGPEAPWSVTITIFEDKRSVMNGEGKHVDLETAVDQACEFLEDRLDTGYFDAIKKPIVLVKPEPVQRITPPNADDEIPF